MKTLPHPCNRRGPSPRPFPHRMGWKLLVKQPEAESGRNMPVLASGAFGNRFSAPPDDAGTSPDDAGTSPNELGTPPDDAGTPSRLVGVPGEPQNMADRNRSSGIVTACAAANRRHDRPLAGGDLHPHQQQHQRHRQRHVPPLRRLAVPAHQRPPPAHRPTFASCSSRLQFAVTIPQRRLLTRSMEATVSAE